MQVESIEERLYLNPAPIIANFKKCLNTAISVDKSGLLRYLNRFIDTQDRYICLSRPRRFGKTWAATMAAAYYSTGHDTRDLFRGLNICADPTFDKHLNKYNVIFINVQNFLSNRQNIKSMIAKITRELLEDLKLAYPEPKIVSRDLIKTLYNVHKHSNAGFIFIIDEWDCIFRVRPHDSEGQKVYLDFLRLLFKDQSYVQLAYMTGILPIKKYGTHSALNMFNEFSMSNPGLFGEFIGFTEYEAKALFEGANMSFAKAREWYDGYIFKNIHVYNPLSVVRAVNMQNFANYWNQTETFEALKMPISLNFRGLKDAVLKLLSMESVGIDIATFQNDMSTFSSADDVLTLLVHLGYLAFDSSKSEVSIPNNEIREEFKNAVKSASWGGVSKLLQASQQLLEDTWSLNAQRIGAAIEEAHNESASVLKYNDENSLCCVITIAYYAANEHYIIFRELASGKGFIDLLFLPKAYHFDKPALLIELKWDKTANGAVAQIKDKNYPQKVLEYTGNIILVGVNYDKETKTHSCAIELLNKD
ncbi:MAG: ATP-binding protein [Clostridiales bacterium]|nr:ATP-binding protein [Clostridiales bacterium]